MSSADWQEDWLVEEEPVLPDENSEVAEERQYQEAFAIADEAHRTLREAREAVRKVRAARGYYAPESNMGKGMSPTSAALNKGKGKSGKSFCKQEGCWQGLFIWSLLHLRKAQSQLQVLPRQICWQRKRKGQELR